MNHLGDTNKMVETPRTDAMRGFHGLDTAVDAEFSEQLELELNAANKRLEEIEKSGVYDGRPIDMALLDKESGDAALTYSIGLDLQKENNSLKDRIKRLEELGKELRECAGQLGWTSSDDSRWIQRAEAAVKAWDKEAKP